MNKVGTYMRKHNIKNFYIHMEQILSFNERVYWQIDGIIMDSSYITIRMCLSSKKLVPALIKHISRN
ncbi:hypothetical protein HZS_715 [Henneguya salminicola]|nr:hypothetical protein HZS_715 [Henneguya salminicola]